MITRSDFAVIVENLGEQATDDIRWSESLRPPRLSVPFALEVVFVICNSGMKNTVARRIFDRVEQAIVQGQPVIDVFGHRGKAAAIEQVWRDKQQLLAGYLAADGLPARLAYLESLPWIGGITKYHLAKNFGEDVAKPDVHMQRLADREGCTVQQLCERLAAQVGLRVATVDTVLWRACANGVLDSRTGQIR